MVTYDFIVINRFSWSTQWTPIKNTVINLLKKYLENNISFWDEKILLRQYKEHYSSAAHCTHPKDILLFNAIEKMIEEYILPAVLADGGFVVLKAYREGVVFVELQGACVGCPSAQQTLKGGIQTLLQSSFSEIKRVEEVSGYR